MPGPRVRAGFHVEAVSEGGNGSPMDDWGRTRVGVHEYMGAIGFQRSFDWALRVSSYTAVRPVDRATKPSFVFSFREDARGPRRSFRPVRFLLSFCSYTAFDGSIVTAIGRHTHHRQFPRCRYVSSRTTPTRRTAPLSHPDHNHLCTDVNISGRRLDGRAFPPLPRKPKYAAVDNGGAAKRGGTDDVLRQR